MQRHLRALVSALALGLFTFGGSQLLAFAQSSPSQEQARGAAFAQNEARSAFACPGAQSARAAGRHYFTLGEARQCAPGAAVSGTAKFALQITATTDLTGYSQTLIVQHGLGQYTIARLTNIDAVIRGSNTAYASGCPEVSTWNEGGWGPLDVYVNNQTKWYRYWDYCSSPYAHPAYVSPLCSSYWPWTVNSCSTSVWNDNTMDVYTDVTGVYGCFCAGATLNAWQEMTWNNGGWWDFSGWETGN